jgi:hypothetical protein
MSKYISLLSLILISLLPLACSTKDHPTPSAPQTTSNTPTNTITTIYSPTSTGTITPTSSSTSSPTITPTPEISPTVTGTIGYDGLVMVKVINQCTPAEVFVNATPTVYAPVNTFEWQVSGPESSGWVTDGSAQLAGTCPAGTYILSVVWGQAYSTGPPDYNVYDVWGAVTQTSTFTVPGNAYGAYPGAAGGLIDCSNLTSYGTEGPF